MIRRFEDLPLDLMRRVDAACDRFETALRSGAAPRVDDYLGSVPDSARLVLLGELLPLSGRSGSLVSSRGVPRRARDSSLPPACRVWS
jgi:hypothetical protein